MCYMIVCVCVCACACACVCTCTGQQLWVSIVLDCEHVEQRPQRAGVATEPGPAALATHPADLGPQGQAGDLERQWREAERISSFKRHHEACQQQAHQGSLHKGQTRPVLYSPSPLFSCSLRQSEPEYCSNPENASSRVQSNNPGVFSMRSRNQRRLVWTRDR